MTRVPRLADRLRADVADVLAADVDVGPDADLVELGIDSVRMMILIRRWQDAGFGIEFADLAAEPTLANWERLLARTGRRAVRAAGRGPDPVSLTVVRVEQLTPRTMRVTLAGEGVVRFAGARPGDHASVIVPGTGQVRSVTVRHHGGAGEVDLDVVAHRRGVLGRWAGIVRPGDGLELVGPYAAPSLPVPADWSLFVIDHTALAALAHRVERAPAGTRVLAVVGVPDTAEEVLLPTVADLTLTWVHRNLAGLAAAMREALRFTVPGSGRGRAWVAGEAALADYLRGALVHSATIGDRCVAEAYWTATGDPNNLDHRGRL